MSLEQRIHSDLELQQLWQLGNDGRDQTLINQLNAASNSIEIPRELKKSLYAIASTNSVANAGELSICWITRGALTLCAVALFSFWIYGQGNLPRRTSNQEVAQLLEEQVFEMRQLIYDDPTAFLEVNLTPDQIFQLEEL